MTNGELMQFLQKHDPNLSIATNYGHDISYIKIEYIHEIATRDKLYRLMTNSQCIPQCLVHCKPKKVLAIIS